MALGYALAGMDESLRPDIPAYHRLHGAVHDGYPDLSLVATSLRKAHTARVNDSSGVFSTRKAFNAGPRCAG